MAKTFSFAEGSRAFLFEPKHLVPYEKAWLWQKQWQQFLFANPEAPQALYILEHTNCYTIGRGGNNANLLFDLQEPIAPWYRIDRGGDVTHHLPGQIVAYPILDLQRYKTDLHWYLFQLEQVLIDVLAVLGLQGERIKGLTGIWLEGKKLGAIGVGCRRWVTQHGLSLNINCSLEGFERVNPCGIAGCEVGRLSEWIPGVKVEEVRPIMVHAFEECFDLVLNPGDPYAKSS